MSLAIVFSRALLGVEAPLVTVEVHISPGLSKLNIVGLAETTVKESKDRVRSAILQCNFEFPMKRITVNLAPADLPKEGGQYDLPIAIGILAASHQIPLTNLVHYEFIGELSLSGEVRAVHCILPQAIKASHACRQLFVPSGCEAQTALLPNATLLSANHLLEICAHLKGIKPLVPLTHNKILLKKDAEKLDLLDVIGQTQAKRALEIAAAGRHSLLLIGSPGTGKTLLANRLPSLLPLLNSSEALEVAALYACTQQGFDPKNWQQVPFRAPHHTSSMFALVGGGRPPRPGEISLAHRGILFLDELPEFTRQALETLREPLEAGKITLSRAVFQTTFPAVFQLIATMNPCPCGYLGSSSHECRCSSIQIQKYIHKLSGPLLDRIDMHVEVPHQTNHMIKDEAKIPSSIFQQNIQMAQNIQKGRQGLLNADLPLAKINSLSISKIARQLLNEVVERLHFSMRVNHRILKLARTIADLEQSNIINDQHVSEAISFRSLDRVKQY